MRKLLSLILALSILSGMTLAVRASTIDQNTPEATHGVEAVYRSAGENAAISVDIAWKGFSFTYTGDSNLRWDAQEHNYLSEAQGGWESSDASVTITNHSNTVIQANIRYDAKDAFTDTELYFTDTVPIIGSAETSEEGSGTPCTVTIKAIPGGILSETAVSTTQIGTITVSVRTDLKGSDAQSAAYDRLCVLHETVLSAGFDTEKMKRGTVYYPSADTANKMFSLLEQLGETVCAAEYPVSERNAALNELITAFYESLEICQNNN